MNKITFLLLHLGFGGIETATINTINALVPYYDIDVISFYRLDNDQKNNLDKRVNVKYLYDEGPNKDAFKKACKYFDIFNIIKEGIKAVNILYLKKKLIKDTIKNIDEGFIVSTRLEFSQFLKYHKDGVITIAQEHRHHRNEKGYIKKLSKLDVDYLFALTEELKLEYEKFLKNKNVKVLRVPNMITMPDKVSNLSDNLITICRLHPIKKVDEMIDIYSKMDTKCKLYIVGDGVEYTHLKKIITEKDLDGKVILTGYKTKMQMEKYILDSKVFLMTSISEGLPMVLLEAMSYGIPCIAYDASGIKDIIEDGKNGYVIPSRDEALYIKKLNDLINDDVKLKEFSKNAIKKANEFTKENVVKIWMNILNNNE